MRQTFPQYIDKDIILTKKQRKQLKELVRYAKIHSPRIAELYKDVDADFTLQDLPVTNKQLIMEDYDNWCTTSDFTLEELKAFTANSQKAGALFKNKYLICKTSGSTGNPFFMAYNQKESACMHINMSAQMKLKSVLHRPSLYLYPSTQHMISVCSVKKTHRSFPLMKSTFKLLDSTIATSKIIDQINQIQPKLLMTYPSSAELLASEQLKGNLHLNLKEIVVGGETLSEKSRSYIQNAFHCKVRSFYACTEASGIASDCSHNHLHLHNSGIILEPVDEHNNPVPAGKLAHKTLLTVLYEKTVPLIRYELNDRIAIHHESCPCGNPSPWITIEGRTATSPFIFKNKHNKDVPVFIFALLLTIESIDGVRKVQLILHNHDKLECRVDFIEGANKQNTFSKIEKVLSDCLKKNDIHNVMIYLSTQKPQVDPKTHKFVKAYQTDL